MGKSENKKSNMLSMCLILLGTIICVAVIVLICDFIQTQKKKEFLGGQASGNEPMKVLVLGDSIWDLERGDTGIASLLEEELSHRIEVYNLAIKGSRSAAIKECLDGNGAFTPEMQRENDICLYSMVQYLTDERPCDIPSEYAASELSSDVDLEEMDYVILAYGLNDYFGAVRQKNLSDGFDPTTYAGSMCLAIKRMQEINPELKFIVVSPTYCQGYSYGQVIHESTSHDYGSGTGYDYAMTAKEVAASFYAVFVDNYDGLDISIHNGAEYLIDATHLSEKGRRAYAANLAGYFVEDK